MSISDYKISTYEDGEPVITTLYPSGEGITGETLKKVLLDRTGVELKNSINGLIDTLKSTIGAGEIGFTQISGINGETVQEFLENLKIYADTALANKVEKEAGKGLFSGSYNDLNDRPSRLAPMVNFVASSGTPAINVDTTDVFDITALAANITNMSANLTGTPINAQKLIIRIKDNGTARSIFWGTAFIAGGAALPVSTVAGKWLTTGFMYNSANSKWMCIAFAQEE